MEYVIAIYGSLNVIAGLCALIDKEAGWGLRLKVAHILFPGYIFFWFLYSVLAFELGKKD